uniref:Uncharacterized protein n=1 Tax=Vespula pensylvanica TaxID=30213 RepID=A0A834PBI3_VESPE|nr:hypothetical protein H0235_003291 [Vespula pensylvanica]
MMLGFLYTESPRKRGGKRGGSGGEGTAGDAGWMEYTKDINDTSSAIVAWLHSPYDATIGGCMFARVKHCFKADKINKVWYDVCSEKMREISMQALRKTLELNLVRPSVFSNVTLIYIFLERELKFARTFPTLVRAA